MRRNVKLTKIISIILLIFSSSCNVDKEKYHNKKNEINDKKLKLLSNDNIRLLIEDSIMEYIPKQKYSGDEYFYKDGTYVNTTEGTHKGKFHIKDNSFCVTLYVERCMYILSDGKDYFLVTDENYNKENLAKIKFRRII
jgi:hypothetical protein